MIIFGFAIFIIDVRYVYFVNLYFRSETTNLSKLDDIILSMFYLNFTHSEKLEQPKILNLDELLSRISLVLLFFIFAFIMLKTLISIIIIRYKYLRSVVQLDNEANGTIFREVAWESNRKFLNLVWWRRPNYKLKL